MASLLFTREDTPHSEMDRPGRRGSPVYSRLLAALLLANPFLVRDAPAQSLLLKDYTTSDGLPDSRVAPIIQDRQGYIWFGTQAGLTRFDGSLFEIFGTAREIPGIFGRKILEDHAGAIWFGYSGFHTGGLLRLWNGISTVIDHRNGLRGAQVFDVAEDRSGDLWVGSDSGLERIHFTDSTRSRWSIDGPYDTAISAVYATREGVLLYASTRGLFALQDGRPSLLFAPPQGRKQWHVRPYSFYEAQNGDLWFGSYEGAHVIHHGRCMSLGESDGMPPRGIWCYREDADGTLWAGTMSGLYRIVPSGGRYRFVKEPSFGDGVVYDMCLDHEGNLWFASAPGLRKLLAKGLVVSFRGEEEMSTPGFGPILAAPGGNLYFGSRTTGLYYRRNGQLGIRRDYGAVSTYTITALFPAGGSGLWMGLWRGGAMLLEPSTFRLYTVRDGLPSNDVHAFTRMGDGRIVIGTSAGVGWMMPDGGIEPLTLPLQREPAVFDLKLLASRDRDRREPDTLCAATDEGAMLIIVDSAGVKSVQRFTNARILEERIVYETLVDRQHRLWFATDGAGVVRIDRDKATTFTRNDGLAGDRVYALSEDSLGNIWIGTSSGLSCFDGSSFHTFTYEQGFGEIGVHGLATDTEGSLWVSSFPGVKKLRPLRFHKCAEPPPLYLTDVQVEESHLQLDRTHELPPDPAVITFHFAALSFTDENNVRYRYRLDGFDRDWSIPVTAREIRYTHLPAGRYTFHVVARSGDGVWTAKPVSFAFSILPPIWLRWWFLAAATLVCAVSIYAVYRFRLNRLLELERTRSRIAMDLHDDIGSSLTRISVMTDVAQRKGPEHGASTSDYLAKVGETARELIEALGDIVWTVDPKHDSLHHAIRRIVQFGQDVCEGRGIAFETEVVGNYDRVRLDPERRRDIYLLFKEGIHNIVRHSGATRARFCTRPTPSGVLLELLDDGKGLPDTPSEEGHGLKSIRQRGERAGLSFTLDGKKGEGTRIALELKTG